MRVYSWAYRGSTGGFHKLWLSVSCELFSLFHHSVLIWLDCFSMMVHSIVKKPPCKLNIFVLQQQQYLGRRFGTSKMHLSPQWHRLLSVLRRWFYCCWFVVDCYSYCGILLLVYVSCALLCLHSSFAIILILNREMDVLFLFFLLVSRDCCVTLPHGAMGFSAICDCCIPLS